MSLAEKKLPITNWWIAEENSLMAFANISLGRCTNKKLKVVGYDNQNNSMRVSDITVSSDHVKKVTTKEIITESGICYPINEAHILYLKFLVQANRENSLIATNWGFDSRKKMMIADILQNGEWKKGIVFDFMPDKTSDVIINGYSSTLWANIVLTPFATNDAPTTLQISPTLYAYIYNTSFMEENAKIELIDKVKKILKTQK